MSNPFDAITQLFAPAPASEPPRYATPAASEGTVLGFIDRLTGRPYSGHVGNEMRADRERERDERTAEREAAARDHTARREDEGRAEAAALARTFQTLVREHNGDVNQATRALIQHPQFARSFARGSFPAMLETIRGLSGPVDPGAHIIGGLQPQFDQSDPINGQSPGRLAQAANMTPEQVRALEEAARLNPGAANTALTGALTARAFPAPPAEPTRNTALDREAARRLRVLQEDGDAANSELVVLGQLDRALQTNPGGLQTGLRGLAAQWGITTGRGTTDLQIVNAMIDRLTPAARQGLPGSASNRDVEMFRGSLPSLWQTPEGQRQVLDTLLALAQHRQARGQIASRAIEAGGGIEDAFSSIRGLPDPFAAMTQRRTAAQVRQLSEAEGVDFSAVPRLTRTALREFNARMIQHYGGAANIPPLVRQLLLQRAQQIDAAGNPQ